MFRCIDVIMGSCNSSDWLTLQTDYKRFRVNWTLEKKAQIKTSRTCFLAQLCGNMNTVIQVMLTLLGERTGSLQFNGGHYRCWRLCRSTVALSTLQLLSNFSGCCLNSKGYQMPEVSIKRQLLPWGPQFYYLLIWSLLTHRTIPKANEVSCLKFGKNTCC
jgi:hypothetical protein